MNWLRGDFFRLVALLAGFAAGMLAFYSWRRGAEDDRAPTVATTDDGRDAAPNSGDDCDCPAPQNGGQSPPATPNRSAGESLLPDRDHLPPDWDASLGSPPQLVDVSGAAKISFHYVNGLTGKYHYPEIMGGGVCLFDYDGDGFLDIYFANGNHLLKEPSAEITNRLYHNNGDGTFTDVTARAGVGHTGFGHGCCAGDYDGDGDRDLFVGNFGPNVLYRNNGDGTFTDVTEAAGVADPNWAQSSSFLDYDGDGRLDLYVQNYLTYSLDDHAEAFIYVGDEKFPDYSSPVAYPGAADHLYHNNGDGTFTDVTEQAGIFYPGGKGMGVACFDANDDGHVDLFVSNDCMENYFFRNRGDGTFEEVGLSVGVGYDGMGIPESSMGVDVGDFDGDGRIDMIVPCTRQQVYTLYRNQGDYFTDESAGAGLGAPTSNQTGFNPCFLDYDNDGDLDLFFTTGGVRADQLLSAEAPYETRYGAADVLLANNGQGKFREVSRFAGPHFQRRLIGRGSAVGDLDNDGDLDLVISNLAGPAVVLRNDTRGGHWITLKLVPRTGHPDALGTSVRLQAGGRTQRAVVHPHVTFLSQGDRRVHFGLGDATRIERLELTWPDRQQEIFEDLDADQFLTIEQGTGDSPKRRPTKGTP